MNTSFSEAAPFISSATVNIALMLPDDLERNCSAEVKRTFGPSINRAPGSYVASSVCFIIKSGCIMLDLPELLAPAKYRKRANFD